MLDFKDIFEREKNAVLYGQSVRFRIAKYIVLFFLGWAIYAWKGGEVLLDVVLVALVVSLCLHFFFRYMTNGWRKSWWLYRHTLRHLLLLNPEQATEAEVAQFTVREAARAVVFDADGNVALLYVGRDEYYKLPGGGIDAGESKEDALRRECLEEIGCDVEIVRELGTIVEYRKMFNIKQISYCYAAKVKGGKGEPKYTEHEIERGFKKLWVPYEEALRLMKESKAKSPEGELYIVPRDVAVLSAVI